MKAYYFLLPTKLTVNFYTLWDPNTIFPLYWIVFYFVPEQATFNGNNILYWAGLEWFLFQFGMERFFKIRFNVNKWTLRSKKSCWMIHFWNGTKREISLLEAERCNCNLIKWSCWLMSSLMKTEGLPDTKVWTLR